MITENPLYQKCNKHGSVWNLDLYDDSEIWQNFVCCNAWILVDNKGYQTTSVLNGDNGDIFYVFKF